MSFQLPLVLGHRGARAVRTENTLEAFDYACQNGIRWVEGDIVLTKDGEAVVFHDDTLDRMAENATGRIDGYTLAELESVTLKGGGKIPTFSAVLDVLKKYDACMNVEIKPSRPELGPATAEKAWDVVRAAGLDDPDRIYFSSFTWNSLDRLKEIAPEMRRGVLVEEESGDWRAAAERVDAYSINYDQDLLTPELIKEIRARYRLMIWTVNDPARAKAFREQGADSFFCDDPVAMTKALNG